VTDYVPMRRGEWPADRADAEREYRARFPEFAAAVDGIRQRLGADATSVRIIAVVNVQGDELGPVTDAMRRDVHRVDDDLPAPADELGAARPYWRGKQKTKR